MHVEVAKFIVTTSTSLIFFSVKSSFSIFLGKEKLLVESCYFFLSIEEINVLWFVYISLIWFSLETKIQFYPVKSSYVFALLWIKKKKKKHS